MTTKGIRNLTIFIVFVVLGLFGVMLYWQYDEYETNVRQKQTAEQELDALEREINEIEEMLVRYEKEKDIFSSYLFDERDIPSFLDDISGSAKETNVNITDMRTQKFHRVDVPEEVSRRRASANRGDKSEEQLQKERMERVLTLSAMPIRVGIEGDFMAIARFLEKLQDYEQMVNVSEIEITRTKEYPLLKSRFVIRIYSLKTLAELET